MNINIIVATGQKNEIGLDNKMPWHMPADLQYFKRITMEFPIIMGRKTYESIGRILPGRTNVIISRNTSYQIEGALHFKGLKEAFNYFKDQGEEQVFVIGGGQIYKETFLNCKAIYRTKIHQSFPEATVFFPDFEEHFTLVSKEDHRKDKQNPFDYSFELWQKNS